MSKARGGYTLRKDGLYVVRITGPNGKRISRYAKTEREAKRLLRDMQARTFSGETPTDSRTSVRAFVEWWLEHRAGRNRAPGTVNEYRSRLNRHVVPVIGNLAVGDVTELDVERVFDELSAKGRTASTIRGTRNALAAMFTDARRAKLVRVNPVRDAMLPEDAERGEARAVPTTAEVRALLSQLKGTELGRLALLLAYTGARIGEALAAVESDFDLDTKVPTWTIARTLARGEKGRTYVKGSTKTRRDRTIVLEPAVVRAMREQRKHVRGLRGAARWWSDGDAFVFPTSIGTARDPRNTRRELHEAAPKWPYGWHELRHYAASIAILDPNVPLAAVSKGLGHASTRTTEQVYVGLVEEAATRFGRAVSQALEQ